MEFIRRRAWLIALALTLLGGGMVAPFAPPISLLATLPFTYLIILLTLRFTARYANKWLIANDEQAGNHPAMESVLPHRHPSASAVDRPQRQRRRIFVAGIVVLTSVSTAAAALWFARVRGDARPDLLMWLLFGVMAVYAGRLVVLFSSSRALRRLERRGSASISTTMVVSALSWIAVANCIFQATCGLGFVLVSGQAWRLAPFTVLAGATGIVLWLRLGDVIAALTSKETP